MVKYMFSMATGYVGSNVEDEMEFDDDVTEDEVLECWKEWVWEQIDGSYIKMED